MVCSTGIFMLYYEAEPQTSCEPAMSVRDKAPYCVHTVGRCGVSTGRVNRTFDREQAPQLRK